MVIKKSRLKQIIREELRRRMNEAEGDEPEEKPEEKPDDKKKEAPPKKAKAPSPKGAAPGALPPSEEPTEEKPEVPDPAAGADDIDEPAGGEVNDAVSGKTVQSVAIEPRSKILPGAKEIIVTFNETTDSLRVLVTATGQVKFAFKGQIYDLP